MFIFENQCSDLCPHNFEVSLKKINLSKFESAKVIKILAILAILAIILFF